MLLKTSCSYNPRLCPLCLNKSRVTILEILKVSLCKIIIDSGFLNLYLSVSINPSDLNLSF